MRQEILIVLWILTATFVAYVANWNGRRAWVWFLLGLALPLVSIWLVFRAGMPEPDEDSVIIKLPRREAGKAKEQRESCRCEGHYKPECHSCPFFRKPRLFGETDESVAGYCEKYNRTLWRDDMR